MKPLPMAKALVACLVPAIASIAAAAIPQFEPPLTLLDPVDLGAGELHLESVAATDGSGTWVVAWSSTERFGGSTLGDFDIVFARSTDFGQSFSERAALNSDAATDGDPWFDHIVEANDFKPSIAADAAGTFVAVWERSRLSGRSIQFARSNDAGVTWTPNTLLSEPGGHPKVATDGNGTWIIVWSSTPLVGMRDIAFTRSTNGGATWSPPALIESGDVKAVNPDIAWSSGVWVVTWGTQTSQLVPGDGDVYAARSLDGGATWSTPAPINPMADTDDTEDGWPMVTSDGQGNWIIAWVRRTSTDSDIQFRRSSDGGATWSAAQKLNSDSETGSRGGICFASDSAGSIVAVWQHASSSYGGDAEVMMSASLDGGATWSAPLPLNDATTDVPGSSGADDVHPFVAHDPAGHWLAVWSSEDLRLNSGTNPGLNIVTALADFACGNGAPDEGEECDTGRRGDLDCCSRTCRFDSPGAVCAADAELCTRERCDGAGTCEHLTEPAGTHCTPDDDLCTFDRCNSTATCEHVVEPRDDCRAPLVAGGTKLEMETDGTPEGSTIKWKWSKGEPTIERDIVFQIGVWDYAMCVFDPDGLVTRIDAPNYADCFTDGGKRDCWTYLSNRGLRYSVREPIPNGMRKLSITTNSMSKGRIKLAAGGELLDFPMLPLTGFPLTVQLVNDSGACWEATYSSSSALNTPNVFEAENE